MQVGVVRVWSSAGDSKCALLQSTFDPLQVGQVPQRSLDLLGNPLPTPPTPPTPHQFHTFHTSHISPISRPQNKRARDYPFILSAPVDVEKGIV